MINGVTVEDLTVFEDDRGFLYEILTQRDDGSVIDTRYNDDGDSIQILKPPTVIPHAYIATARPGVAKAWHMHTRQTDRFCVVHGTAKVGLVDLRGHIFSDNRTHVPMQEGGWEWGVEFQERILGMVGDRHVLKEDECSRRPAIRQMARVWKEMIGEVSDTYFEFQTVVLTGNRPKLLTIPPYVAHGQMALGEEMSFLLNLPTKVHNRNDPDEIRIPCDAFHKWFSWEVVNR